MYDLNSVKLLFEAAQELNLQPKMLTDYGLFSIQLNHQTDYVFYSTSFLNRHVHSYLAKNKHVTRIILAENGFLNIPFLLPQSLAEAKEFLSEHQQIIAKPTLGQHSENVHLITTEVELEKIKLSENILEKYIKGKEYRCLVLNDEVIAVHHKDYHTPINDLAVLKRVSFEKTNWDPQLVKTAKSVAKTLHLKLAAVDFMIQPDGTQFVLEVNSSPGIARFHFPDQGPAINFAKMLLEAVVAEAGK